MLTDKEIEQLNAVQTRAFNRQKDGKLLAKATKQLLEGGSDGGDTGFETVAEIPETLDPGQIVFVTETGSLWVGASDDYFPTLDEGTPWPLKGYKGVQFGFQAAPFELIFLEDDGIVTSTTMVDEDVFRIGLNIGSGIKRSIIASGHISSGESTQQVDVGASIKTSGTIFAYVKVSNASAKVFGHIKVYPEEAPTGE